MPPACCAPAQGSKTDYRAEGPPPSAVTKQPRGGLPLPTPLSAPEWDALKYKPKDPARRC